MNYQGQRNRVGHGLPNISEFSKVNQAPKGFFKIFINAGLPNLKSVPPSLKMTKLAFKIWRPGARQFGKKVYCHYSFTVILLFTVAALESLLHALILSYFFLLLQYSITLVFFICKRLLKI